MKSSASELGLTSLESYKQHRFDGFLKSPFKLFAELSCPSFYYFLYNPPFFHVKELSHVKLGNWLGKTT